MNVLLLTGMLAGCAGIPFATMWRMRNFGPVDFTRLEPAYIRTAVQLPTGLDLKDSVTTLSISLTRKHGGTEKLAMPLQRVADGRVVDPGLHPADDGMHWLLFKLTGEGVKSFQHIQGELRAHRDAYKSMNIYVRLNFTRASKQRLLSMQSAGQHLAVSMWLRLQPAEGFFKLYGGELKLSGDRMKP
ncbi:MAG: hypothetical protein ACYDB9_02590 [Gammaproteobacteria bacterium]